LNLVIGQSGNVFSPHYMDHWPAWYKGHTFPFPFTSRAVEQTRAHELRLEPAK
jgi:penicillin amidase